ncbi:thioredoxin domain-containing protein [Pseudomonas marginalis]|nr:thioredoxin family protein [Pseudomonas marginalis]MCM2381086.1 thioredoxin family protein [Pseudomonas marginalis]
MGIAKDIIACNEDYQSMLAAHSTVFMLFVSQTCPACASAVELFEPIAENYEPTVKSVVLDTAKTPRLEQVTGTPTLVVHANGKIKEILKGFGPWETQEQTLKEVFSRYARQQAPDEPA